MSQSYEVEYCNLELLFDRRQIQNLIKDLIEYGYSLYWSENEYQFIMSIRTGRKLVKLKFDRMEDQFKMVGTYSFKDPKLSDLMEKLIENTRGHAVVKRFKDSQILIENIMYGEIIRTVEISGIGQKVLYEKSQGVTLEQIAKAMQSRRIEERIPILRMELDNELARLHELLQHGNPEAIEACKRKLETLRQEMLMLEG